jgi:hypothetical protein
VWRAWTHWKAFKASDYLQSLVQRGAIAPEAHEGLDKIYAEHRPRALPPSSTSEGSSTTSDSTASSSETPPTTPTDVPGPLLLTKDAVPHILDLFGLPESAARDIYRALEQARQRIEAKV